MNTDSAMQVSGKRSQPLKLVDLYISREHWEAIKTLARARDLSAAEVVRRLIAAELRKTAKAAPAAKAPVDLTF